MTGTRLERGATVISIDTELAWGEAHRNPALERDYGAERAVIGKILDLFTRYRIPATWAVVGHLFLDRCAAADGRPHPEIVRPAYPWRPGDWLDVDPCSTLEAAPWFYGRDIVDAIRACPVEQEIGCHSFSHLIAGDAGCSEDAFTSDLAACRSVAASAGVELRSFVFPRNAIGHVDRLAEHGFTCYRGRAPVGSAAAPVRQSDGVWNVPQTYLFAPATRRRWLPITVWAMAPRARLRQAAREGSLFHLWFHPYNVAAAPQRALRGLEAICREADRLRDAGRLDVLTMSALADRLERRNGGIS